MGSRGVLDLATARFSLHRGRGFSRGAPVPLSDVSALPFRPRSARAVLFALLPPQPIACHHSSHRYLPVALCSFLRATRHSPGRRLRCSAGSLRRAHRKSSAVSAFPGSAGERLAIALARAAAPIPEPGGAQISGTLDLWRRHPLGAVSGTAGLER